MNICALALGVLAGAVAPAGADTPGAKDRQDPAADPPGIVSAIVRADPVLRPGESILVDVEIRIDSEHHVMANPASEDYLVPLRVELRCPDGLEAGEAIYPEAVPFAIQGTDGMLATYDGTIVVRVPVSADAAAPRGRHLLRGTLEYQGCSRHTCLMPSVLEFRVEALVTGTSSP